MVQNSVFWPLGKINYFFDATDPFPNKTWIQNYLFGLPQNVFNLTIIISNWLECLTQNSKWSISKTLRKMVSNIFPGMKGKMKPPTKKGHLTSKLSLNLWEMKYFFLYVNYVMPVGGGWSTLLWRSLLIGVAIYILCCIICCVNWAFYENYKFL